MLQLLDREIATQNRCVADQQIRGRREGVQTPADRLSNSFGDSIKLRPGLIAVVGSVQVALLRQQADRLGDE